MFGKLMKYELRYLIRIFAPMWAVVLALCVLSRITLNPDIDGMMVVEGWEAILPVVIIMLTVFAIVTMMIVAAVVLLQRFYKGMYGDEGYLMFTLPVTTGSLVHSKALSALLMMLGTELLTVVGVLIMVSYPHIWHQIDMNWSELFETLLEMNGLTAVEFVLLAFWMSVVGVLTILQGIYLVYLAISIGQLWKKHPVAGSIGAYYILTLIINFAVGGLGAVRPEYWVDRFAVNMDYSAALAVVLIGATLYCVVLIGISAVSTKLILDKKLNIA